MDVDGVLTDGKIVYDSTGAEWKAFNVKDGLGISMALRAGLELGVITARKSPMVERRAHELGIRHLFQETKAKLPAFEVLMGNLGLKAEQVAYIGDDLPDLPPLRAAGLACCPADAARTVREACHLVSDYRGGDGAVRDILEFILESQGLLSQFC
jgi:3-deoxy-D-manno-octulosonate 8-phosphate phosphatase (KDO 8-P phosphatase)